MIELRREMCLQHIQILVTEVMMVTVVIQVVATVLIEVLKAVVGDR